MKKLIRKIKLRRFKDSIPESAKRDFIKQEFIVLYRNNKYKLLENEEKLNLEIERNIGDIWYIFDMVDRMILDKNIEIEQGEEKNE